MPQDDLLEIVDLINDVLNSGRFDLKATIEESDDGFKVELRGGDVSLLLGHNAELLDALEYLASRIYTHRTGKESRIVFDSNNYRARREKELRLMAEKAAEKVRVSRKPFTFDPMNPVDRRIIHLALSEDASVRTESQGSGENRKVTIYPA